MLGVQILSTPGPVDIWYPKNISEEVRLAYMLYLYDEDAVLNTSEFNSEFEVLLYPNPATDILNYSLKPSSDRDELFIADMTGRVLYRIFEGIDKVGSIPN